VRRGALVGWLGCAVACAATFDGTSLVGEWAEESADGGATSGQTVQLVVDETGKATYGTSTVTFTVDALNQFSILVENSAVCSSCSVGQMGGAKTITCRHYATNSFGFAPTCQLTCVGGNCAKSQ
jgi:hypothetical protein